MKDTEEGAPCVKSPYAKLQSTNHFLGEAHRNHHENRRDGHVSSVDDKEGFILAALIGCNKRATLPRGVPKTFAVKST